MRVPCPLAGDQQAYRNGLDGAVSADEYQFWVQRGKCRAWNGSPTTYSRSPRRQPNVGASPRSSSLLCRCSPPFMRQQVVAYQSFPGGVRAETQSLASQSGSENREDIGRQEHQMDDARQQSCPTRAVRNDCNHEAERHQHTAAHGDTELEWLTNPL